MRTGVSKYVRGYLNTYAPPFPAGGRPAVVRGPGAASRRLQHPRRLLPHRRLPVPMRCRHQRPARHHLHAQNLRGGGRGGGLRGGVRGGVRGVRGGVRGVRGRGVRPPALGAGPHGDCGAVPAGAGPAHSGRRHHLHPRRALCNPPRVLCKCATLCGFFAALSGYLATLCGFLQPSAVFLQPSAADLPPSPYTSGPFSPRCSPPLPPPRCPPPKPAAAAAAKARSLLPSAGPNQR